MKATKYSEATWEMTSPCNCTTCAGRPGIPPETGKPWRRWHEIQSPPEPLAAPAAINIAPPTPKPRPAPAPAPLGTIQERIDAIRARTDIGNGMKAMQIKNLMRKL